ncbi:MAG TPA: HNH endonuclease [Candidatus Deferrimicrobiaceae bacterium]|jgi:putative restriction endonuclease
MNREKVLAAFDRIRIWRKGGRRAPHKPLLILLELGRMVAGGDATVEFAAADSRLKALLDEFGPGNSGASRHYPFWHLQSDGVWSLEAPFELLNRPMGATPTIGELRSSKVRGGFPVWIREAFQKDPALISIVAQRVVAAHFPESIREDVLEAAGLGDIEINGESSGADKPRRRDPAFREKVLLAYEYRCCVCGHDMRLGRQCIGLEAAHIKWVQANGPDIESNGLALCSLHHKFFDLGVFTVLPDQHRIAFSRHAITHDRALSLHGAHLSLPPERELYPDPEYLEWHRKEVFKDPPRSFHA